MNENKIEKSFPCINCLCIPICKGEEYFDLLNKCNLLKDLMYDIEIVTIPNQYYKRKRYAKTIINPKTDRGWRIMGDEQK
jgi:hypothetical protein